MVSFGLRMLMRVPERMTFVTDRGAVSLSTERAPLSPGRPRHVEQVRHAEVLQRLECHCAGVQQPRDPVIAANMRGTIPSVHPIAALTLAWVPRDRLPPPCR